MLSKIDIAEKYSSGYKYLCQLEEAKIWMESILNEPLPATIDLQESLRNGVYLAKIGNFIAPNKVPLSRIYDIFQHRYKSAGLQFRHTDNINCWIEALKSIGFPKIFIIETTDVYDKKNMPKVIYCIHALSMHLFGLGQAPLIQDLFGKIHFSHQDIKSISNEIQKNEISLPAFQKIGHLLAKELTNDFERLHVDLIDLNNAIDEKSEKKLFETLNSCSVGFLQIIPEYIGCYLTVLNSAKEEKVCAAKNRSTNKSYEPDIFDELLNQIEIQGHIRKVNIDCAWQDILKSIKKKKKENLKEIIATSFIQIKDYKEQNIEFYVNEALSLDLSNLKSNKSRDIIQTIVCNGNRNATELYRVSDAIAKVKEALWRQDKEKLLSALRSPVLKLSSQVSDFAAPLYLEEMLEDVKMSEELNYNDIKCSVSVLNGIAKITSAVDSRNVDAVWRELSNSNVPFMNIDPILKTQYFKALCACREEKLKQNVENRLLTFVDIQESIDIANVQDFQQTQTLTYLAKINESIQNSNFVGLLPALRGIALNEIADDDLPLYIGFLKQYRSQKQRTTGEELWLEDVTAVVKEVTILKNKISSICEQLCSNKNFPSHLSDNVLKSMENYEKQTHPTGVLNSIKNLAKKNARSPKSWFTFQISEEICVYYNPMKKVFKCCRPLGPKDEELHLLPVDSLEFSFNSNRNSPNKANLVRSHFFKEQFIVKLQAVIRGFIIRQNVKILKAVIRIQRWWRKIKNDYLYAQESAKASFPLDLNYYAENIDKIVKLQAVWRGYKCRKNFRLKLKKPCLQFDSSFQILRNLASSGQINAYDYTTDLKIQATKSSIVQTIKLNQDLAFKLEEMDIKIALLVQNRMSVEAIVAENKKLQNNYFGTSDPRGIKAFSKDAKRLLDGYQQLFYLLQTDPAYLTRLIVRLPSKLNHVIQSCVFSLFNYGSNSRDAYLLLRLFRSALFEEVQSKFQRPVDVVTGNPLVLRLAVAFARQAEGHNPLKNILGFLIEKVLNDKVCLDTNPLDIYRRWINQMETETGRPSNLPQSVTQDEALLHPEVLSRLNHNLRILKSWVKCFLDRLTLCVNQFPYALRFIAKLLKNALLQKFPQTPEKDILKIVGNLVYYQYINCAIVAPDAFCTISLPPNQPMKAEQRRNLASIAKILHFAATKKGFGEESKYLMCLNPFIVECHKEMKRFCQNCCNVEDLEEHFHVTKYSEAALIDKPRIYITLEEIRECHKLLLEVRHEIAPDPLDRVHDILDELGSLPSIATLIGCSNSCEPIYSSAGKMQVYLELDNKFQSPPEDPDEFVKLFIKTKELIMRRLNELNGDALSVAIRDPKHADIATNLAKLELAGLVRSNDDYQDIVGALVKDVFHKQEYEKLQKKELNVLRTAQQRLNEKKKFYEDQVAHYEQYLKTCLSNLTAPRNKAKEKKERSLKYSGTRLLEKGILISLDGVPLPQLKNVQFEISKTKFNGIYAVHGRFMGIEVEKIDIDIQELLKLQFEGFREMDLFGKARINVNLLLHLLNKKFHARI